MTDKPIDSHKGVERDEGECIECGGYMHIPFGYEPTERCSHCWQKDSERLSWLAELFEHCPHAVISYNEDPDADEPVGWSIFVSGCLPLEVVADSFRGAIDAGIAESARQDAAIRAGEDPEA